MKADKEDQYPQRRQKFKGMTKNVAAAESQVFQGNLLSIVVKVAVAARLSYA